MTSADRLPEFSLVIPDMCHSMHECPLAVGDAWLRKLVPKLASSEHCRVRRRSKRGRLRVRGGGHVPALALGSAVSPRSRYTAVANHYGLLRTIEEAWGLPLLGSSARVIADHGHLEGIGGLAGTESGLMLADTRLSTRCARPLDRRSLHACHLPRGPGRGVDGRGTTGAFIPSASAAPVHDIGKVMIAASILRKRGPLLPEELAEIQTHPSAARG